MSLKVQLDEALSDLALYTEDLINAEAEVTQVQEIIENIEYTVEWLREQLAESP